MKKEIKRQIIFEKQYDGIINGFRASDLPKDLLPSDIIEFHKEEGYYSESNSCDDSSTLIVYREREETDLEFSTRLRQKESLEQELKNRRHETYLKLKQEFEK